MPGPNWTFEEESMILRYLVRKINPKLTGEMYKEIAHLLQDRHSAHSVCQRFCFMRNDDGESQSKNGDKSTPNKPKPGVGRGRKKKTNDCDANETPSPLPMTTGKKRKSPSPTATRTPSASPLEEPMRKHPKKPKKMESSVKKRKANPGVETGAKLPNLKIKRDDYDPFKCDG